MKIVLACGGTGGHIFPAFSVAEELRRRDPNHEIIYICGTKDIESAIFKIVAGEKVIEIESAPFRGTRSLFDLQFLLKLIKGIRKARRILVCERPDVVVGFGGHFSFPMVCMARQLGIPALVHEQNVIPGAANKLLARWANGVALSFRETEAYWPSKKGVRFTGNPIRSAIECDTRQEALAFFGFSPDKITLLALGGSQGSASLNAILIEAFKIMPGNLRERLQVLHLCGKMSPEESSRLFRSMGVNARAYSFFERMDLAYGATDLAFGRAGATFLAEIDAKRIPALLVPYPFGNGHQRANAEIFTRSHKAVVIEQNELTPERFLSALEQMLKNYTSGQTREVGTSSARRLLADYIFECAEGVK